MAHGSTARVVGLGGNDPLFARIRSEAEDAARGDPALAAFLTTRDPQPRHAGGRGHPSRRRPPRPSDAPSALIRQAYEDVVARDASIGEAFRADLIAVPTAIRPACG